jgi:type I restriction enzyme, S subunit
VSNGWKECKLGDVVIKTIDNRGKNPPYSLLGHEVIETSSISGINKYPDYSAVKKFISQDCYENWFRTGHPQDGDIIIITVGNGIGNVCIMNSDRGVLTQNLIGLRLNQALVNRDYAYYYLSWPPIQNYLRGLDIGSAQPSIKVPHLLNTIIPVPPLPEQQAIAGVLSSLDDKIDLLHRQNKTLEGIVEALWRKMFMEAADPGWEPTTIGKIGTLNGKSIGKNYPYTEIEYLDTGSITESRISEFQPLQLKEAPSRARRIVQKDDIIISMVRPIQKHYGILKKVKHNTVVSTGFIVITCTEIDPHFMYVLLTQKEMTEYLDVIAEASTTTYPSLVPSDIAGIASQMPPTELMQQFSEYAASVWDKIEENNSQIRTLSRLRDPLPPDE